MCVVSTPCIVGRESYIAPRANAVPPRGRHGVNCTVDITVDNFVDRLFSGQDHWEIRRTSALHGTTGQPTCRRPSALPFHVKHCQARAQMFALLGKSRKLLDFGPLCLYAYE